MRCRRAGSARTLGAVVSLVGGVAGRVVSASPTTMSRVASFYVAPRGSVTRNRIWSAPTNPGSGV
jgi:hypothetical protein